MIATGWTRRAVMAAAARAGVAGLVTGVHDPLSLLAQVTLPGPAGKEKLLVKSMRPPDYESPVALLDAFITPIEHFYVHSHLPVPPVADRATWRLHVEGEVGAPVALGLDDLRAMPSAIVTTTLECAGNGRAFYDPPVAGIQWGRGAVGTARWKGARLKDVLTRAGITPAGRFVLVSGADRPLGKMPEFIRQIPIAKAMHPDTLVAYEMNGAPIPQLHGAPLRVIVPGWEGAYSVKWLNRLRVVDREFDGFWVATAYRYPTRRVAPGSLVAPADLAPLTGLVVKSLITQPLEGTVVALGTVNVAGFAWAGEHAIARVDVSVDHGASWQPARLVGERAPYTWRRFEFAFATRAPESYLILSRATDVNGRTQPIEPPWNPAGYLWNAPDRVRVEVTA